MVLKLYMINISPYVRAVLMCAKELDLQLELKEINLFKQEQFSPEFLKMNPEHIVPTLDDDGFILWDSHAIMAYFVNKYAKDDKLYPKEAQKRATVDQRLHFESGHLFERGVKIVRSLLIGKTNSVNLEDANAAKESYKILETLLEKTEFIAGDTLTIADISIYCTLCPISVLVPIEETLFPKLSAWMERINQLPSSQVNKDGLNMLIDILQDRLQT